MISNELFRRHIVQNFGGKLPPSVLIALSGGVDSMCLTFLLSRYRDLYQRDMHITAITIDHKYRNGSDKEAKQVGSIVSQWGVNHIVKQLSYSVPDVKSITSFEKVARQKRYEAFRETCTNEHIGHVFLAHNLNDQLETFLQRLQSNSTIFGLVGLKHVSDVPIPTAAHEHDSKPIEILRPLLPFDKHDIIETCTHNRVKWFEDPTNSDLSLTKRNMLRHIINHVIPSRPHDDYTSVLQKRQLCESLREVQVATDLLSTIVENRLAFLASQNWLSLCSTDSSLSLELLKSWVSESESDCMILGRLLFHILYPISSVKHYHWSYAKLERRVIPQLADWLHQDSSKPLKLTYLNLLMTFTSSPSSQTVSLTCVRQPILTDDLPKIRLRKTISQNWSDWLYFDRRYWLRLRAANNIAEKDVMVMPYTNRLKKLVAQAFPNISIDSKVLEGTPVIISECEDRVHAIPTHGLSDGRIECQWNLKANPYKIKGKQLP